MLKCSFDNFDVLNSDHNEEVIGTKVDLDKGLFTYLSPQITQDSHSIEDEAKSWYWIMDQIMCDIYFKFSKNEVLGLLKANLTGININFSSLGNWYNKEIVNFISEHSEGQTKEECEARACLINKLESLSNLEKLVFAKWIKGMQSESVKSDSRDKICEQELEKFSQPYIKKDSGYYLISN